MKIFLTLFFSLFIFHSSSNAEDISEFEIEGISVNDKLLNHISKNEIENSFNQATYYKNKKYVVIFVNIESTIYDRLQATLKTNDNKYIIYSLEGIIDFDKNIKGCLSKKKEIFNDLKSVFNNAEIIHNDSVYTGDESGKSFSYGTWFYLKNGGYASITCTEMGEKVRDEKGWSDELSIGISNQEFLVYLQNEAYN
tara:strand:+ start:178 stop:765 length:588 start_codon:yes stop_codon:yes gene_type:complete